MIESKLYDPGDPLMLEFRHALKYQQWIYSQAIKSSEIVEQKNQVVLDAGCGYSVFAHYLASKGHEVHAFDLKGKHRQSPHKNLTEYDMDITDIKFEDGYFDYVFCLCVLGQVVSGDNGDIQATKELARVMKPGGTMVLALDLADRYYPMPGLWPNTSHRIYDRLSIKQRILKPAKLWYWGNADLDCSEKDLTLLEPINYDYTVGLLTVRKTCS